MQTIKVVNIKCGGCANSIKKGLESEDLKNINVNITTQEVSFEGDKQKAIEKLTKMGYPQLGSKEADSILKKAQSFVSCGIGKMN